MSSERGICSVRENQMDKSWINQHRLHPEYIQGVKEFIKFACENKPLLNEVTCPCKRCRNVKLVEKGLLGEHLMINGFLPSYTSWNLNCKLQACPLTQLLHHQTHYIDSRLWIHLVVIPLFGQCHINNNLMHFHPKRTNKVIIGGGGGGGVAFAAAPAGGGGAPAAEAPPAEEKKEEKEESEDEDMGFSLFDYTPGYCGVSVAYRGRAKLPLYAFKRVNKIVGEKGLIAHDYIEPSIAFLDSLLLGEWEDRMQRGLFRYDVTACKTKVIPGEYGFIAQLNEGRHLKKRPTEFRVDKVLQPFDGNKFNFTKVGQEENSPSVVAINVSPIEYGHVLLIPWILECLPQRIDRVSFLLALYMAAEAGNPYFRLGYNSLGAFATINHLHFQVHTQFVGISGKRKKAYYLAVPFPIEKAPIREITTLNSGVKISELLNYPVRGLVFEGGNTLEDLSNAVSDSCICLQDNNVPYNVLIFESGKRIYPFVIYPFSFSTIVHGDLKPENILLDSNLNCKLYDFGICRLMPGETLRCPSFRRYTEPKGAFSYTDPEVHRTGSLTPKSDVYSFGLIILQLLTGRTPVGLSILDSSAGEWPNLVSKQLVDLGLQCCELNSRDRPELTPSLVKELEQLHTSEELPVPSFFLCPILKGTVPDSDYWWFCFQEIMHDPQEAADGFTYEGDALHGWLESGRETSPMTNLRLDHLHLTPNHALRLAIQDWLCKV
ncbi:unnamed protein product [Camellia sinensis]